MSKKQESIHEAIGLLRLFKKYYIKHDIKEEGCYGCVLTQRVKRVIDELTSLNISSTEAEEGSNG
jgi:hypothetical protein